MARGLGMLVVLTLTSVEATSYGRSYVVVVCPFVADVAPTSARWAMSRATWRDDGVGMG